MDFSSALQAELVGLPDPEVLAVAANAGRKPGPCSSPSPSPLTAPPGFIDTLPL